MRLKHVAAAFALAGALGVLAVPAEAAPRHRVTTGAGHTVVITRDENGRTRTRIIIQKRSYLDPGTETIPGERSDHEYAFLPGQRGIDVQDNTPFGANQTALPGPFTLPSKNNPVLGGN
jgi:hypothetical protein